MSPTRKRQYMERRGWLSGSSLRVVLFIISPAALGRDGAPPSPAQPWSTPRLGQYEAALARENFRHWDSVEQIDPRKVYSLPESIDFAAATPKAPHALKSRKRMIAADAFTNPAHVRFAFKVTLAALVFRYVWPEGEPT